MSRLATPEGTAAYAKAHPAADGHFRTALGLTVSTLGFGSYLGDATPARQASYVEAFAWGLQHGVNVVDTAQNYRAERSEKAVGEAIRVSGVGRDGIVVATKGGYVPFPEDAEPRAWFRERYVTPGIADAGDLAMGCHVMTPAYLADAFERSLANLGLEAVDVYFIHNPETQLAAGAPMPVFLDALRNAFTMLEEKRREGRLSVYGLATWDGLRTPPGRPKHLPLERILDVAREVGGPQHGFRAVELPYNIGMAEAAGSATQPWRGETVPALALAAEAGLLVLGSASLLQGQLLGHIHANLREVLGVDDDAHAAIQFSRSTPGMTTALVGTGSRGHAEHNLAVARTSPRPEAVQALFEAAGEGAYHRE